MNIPGQETMQKLAKQHASLLPGQTEEIAIVRSVDGEQSVPTSAVLTGQIEPELGPMLDYAALSTAVYRTVDEVIEDVPALETVFKRWELLNIRNFDPNYHRPKWTLRVGNAEFQVWKSQQRNEIVICFRGTDFKQATDWFSNFRWVTRFIPRTWDQYEQVQAWIDELIDAIRQDHPEATIITSGHSLGGGLAQQALYATKVIKRSVTFHPSMVTGYYAIRPKTRRRANADGGLTYRIFEHGEVLAYLRWAMKKFYNPFRGQPRIVEVRLNLLRRKDGNNAVDQHSIIHFARRLAELTAALPKKKPISEPPSEDSPLVA